MVNREIKGKYFIAFLLTASIFVLGIFLGIIMSDFKMSRIYDYEVGLMTNFLVQDVQSQLINENPCDFVNSGLVSQELFEVGDRVTALEKDLGKKDDRVLSLKKYYTVLQVKDYLFFKNVNEKCNSNYILNLFFYSNDPRVCERCEDQGFVLGYLRADNINIRTYSFDVNLDLPIVKYLISYYNVTVTPTVIFNDKVYSGFISADQLNKLLVE
ncbi:hypothetical protein HYU23_03385 [Candidatus Woesearchaeota archaeon]|nr:hypothetical protein [Candidatus Woesearchaeota archaeon]